MRRKINNKTLSKQFAGQWIQVVKNGKGKLFRNESQLMVVILIETIDY